MKTIRSVLLALFTVWFSAPLEAGEQSLTVVELFTSEGCSSCPPADDFLGALTGRDDILALSLHVDYWDYIGWKDRFADPRYTERQRAYAKQFKLRYVYTPQIVVDGAYESVGSDRDKVFKALDAARGTPKVPVLLSGSGGKMTVKLPASANVGAVRVLSVFYTRRRESRVKSGENSGRKLAHSNVVSDLSEVAVWRGEAVTLPIPASSKEAEVCAILLQSLRTGRIIGAGQKAL